ncbi:HTH-type transcriptional regulator DmlR [compost metagenome]
MRANNGDLLRCAALDGLGIIMQPDFIVGDDIRTGRLVPLLPDYSVTPIGIHVLYPHRRYLSAKVRAFAEHLAVYFGEAWAHGAG